MLIKQPKAPYKELTKGKRILQYVNILSCKSVEYMMGKYVASRMKFAKLTEGEEERI